MAYGDLLFQNVTNPFYSWFQTNNKVSGCGLDQPTVPFRQLLRPYPQYCGVVSRYSPGGTSNYNALMINYRHTWSDGLHLLASYTRSQYKDDDWGPGFGYAPSIYNRKDNYGLHGNDIPNSLVVSWIYELPFGHGKTYGAGMNSVANAIVGGWQISAITMFKDGFPIAPVEYNNNLNTFNAGQRPDCSGDPALDNPTIDKWFNTDVFSLPAAYTFGNCPRTFGSTRAAGRNAWDMTVSKWWRIGERFRVQFRGEFFNAFNHTDLFGPDTGHGSSTFGQVTSTGSPRDIQLGLKIYW